MDITIDGGQQERLDDDRHVTALHDILDEGSSETVVFSGVAAGGLTTTETATLTINDNDNGDDHHRAQRGHRHGGMSGNQVDIGEDGSETTVTVTATLAGSAAYTVARTVAVAGGVDVGRGDAVPGRHQRRLPAEEVRRHAAPSSVTLPISLGDITIPAGSLSASQTFKVNPNDDEVSEGTETITVGGSACLTADRPVPRRAAVHGEQRSAEPGG